MLNADSDADVDAPVDAHADAHADEHCITIKYITENRKIKQFIISDSGVDLSYNELFKFISQ